MSMSTLNRLAMTITLSATMAALGFPGHAQSQSDARHQQQAEAKQDKQDEKDDKKDEKASQKAQQQQQRLSRQEQQERIRQQQQSLARYNQRIAQQQAIARRHAQELEQQKRLAHYRFQQAYYERLRQQQERLQNDRYDFEADPFYYTPPTYRYRRDDRYYETNQYGVEVLRQASNTGYQEGYLAGRADKQDDWRFDYKQSFAYQDANYGYDGRYVQQEDYNYYFREGFQRGYDDGYYERRQYGRSAGGANSLLDAVLGAILSLEALR